MGMGSLMDDKEKSEPSKDEDEDLGGMTKKVAAKTLIAAVKAGDASAAVKALDAYMSACGYGDDEEE